ncbi:ankyrin repeat domain-containing protein SOWAHD [Cynoglossus semilaevis]|nr:ankyrin repeat domain-containing protein SOWAHD [Cynoglossus semilaevis]
MEHAWMLCAADGNLNTILDFATEDPYLLTRRDFISGFSVLHWLAKRGQDEDLVKVLRFAHTAGVPVDVNARGSGGLTPLHVASMHGHHMVIKHLVGAFGADVEQMDYNGKRAWQYLSGDAPQELKELLGSEDEHAAGGKQTVSPGDVTFSEEVQPGPAEEIGFTGRRSSSWRFGSLRKFMPSVSFIGNKT